MDLAKLSAEDLAEWRAHPVTALIQECLRLTLEAQAMACTAAYWAGNPWPEAERLSHLRAKAQWEDLFESDAADIRETMERLSGKYERDKTR